MCKIHKVYTKIENCIVFMKSVYYNGNIIRNKKKEELLWNRK